MRRWIARCRELNWEERRLLLRAFILVASIRLALWFLPFRLTRAWVAGSRRRARLDKVLERRMVDRLSWAVEAAGRRIPQATCLSQALAMQILLGERGQDSELQLGVARDSAGRFKAHAWVESAGRIVKGGAAPDFSSYIRLTKSSP